MEQQIEVPAIWPSISALLAFVDTVEATMPLSKDQCYVLRLVVEEVATNIIKYGYAAQNPGVIQLTCAYINDTLSITMRDHGQPFDPRELPDPALGDDAATRDVGGLGLFLIRAYVDALSYIHDAQSGWNELVVTKGTE